MTCAALRPCRPPPAAGSGSSGGGGRRGRILRGLLGAGSGAAAAGLTSLAASSSGGLPSLAAAGLPSRGGGGGYSPRPGEFGDPARRATDVLLVANVVLYGLQLASGDALTAWGIKVNSLIQMGQWWRLITPAFLHGGIVHLAVNSFSLNNLGPAVEKMAGTRRYLVMYAAAAVASTLVSFRFSPNMSLGASGAIFGLGGALAVHFYRNRELYGRTSDRVLRSLWQTLLMNLAYSLANPRIDNWGHMGGLLGGALAALLVGPQYRLTTLPGQRGQWLVDAAPLPFLRSKPRRYNGRG